MVSGMADFGKWIKIEPGCEMPDVEQEVLILYQDNGSTGYPGTYRGVWIGVFVNRNAKCWPCAYPELGGFVIVDNGGDEDCNFQKISVLAWMPMPPVELE